MTKAVFWSVAAVVAAVEIGLMVWTLPPTELQGQIAATIEPPEPNRNGGPVVCTFDQTCKQDGRLVLGERKRYTVCSFGGPCWVVEGVPVRY